MSDLDESLLNRLTESEDTDRQQKTSDSESVEDRIRESHDRPEIDQWIRESYGRAGILMELESMADDWIERNDLHTDQIPRKSVEFINYVRDHGGNVKYAQEYTDIVLAHAKKKRTENWMTPPDCVDVDEEQWETVVNRDGADCVNASDFLDMVTMAQS